MTNLQLRYQLVQLQNLIRQILHPLPVSQTSDAYDANAIAYSRGIQLANMLLIKTRHELEDIYYRYILKPRLRDLEAGAATAPPTQAPPPVAPPAAVAATLTLLQLLHRRNSIRRFQPPLSHIV
jgi:hypothetical protein